MLKSSEGHEYTTAGGLKTGLPTHAVISPPDLHASTTKVHDVIVIGAGYAGLTAIRDLATQGLSVLLIEGRDRIGGRTWTSFRDGHAYEMGGTWIHWWQPHVWNEITRYGLNDQIVDSLAFHEGCVLPSSVENGVVKEWQVEEMLTWQIEAMDLFFNADGKLASDIIPYPFNPPYGQAGTELQRYDKMSVQGRLDQIADKLTAHQRNFIEIFTAAMGGRPMKEISYWDMMHRWVLSGSTVAGIANTHNRYKLKCGQTEFARCFFDAAEKTGRLSYTFSTGVKTINYSDPEKASVTSADGRTFTARKVICTVPLTVLKDLTFVPELPAIKVEAISNGAANRGRKVHAEVEGKQFRSWTGTFTNGQELGFSFGDAFSPEGNTHLVYFNIAPGPEPVEDPAAFLKWAESFHPQLKVKKIVFPDYWNSPYSRGTWACHQPDWTWKYLKALQESVGNLKFASGDYCGGWKAYIDGAIEGGMVAAKEVLAELA